MFCLRGVRFWAALGPSQAGLGVSLYAWSDLLFCPLYRGLHRGEATVLTNSSGPRRLRLPTHRPPSSHRHLHLRHPCSPRSHTGSLVACPLATFGAPFLPALTHVLSQATWGLVDTVEPSTRRKASFLAYSDLTYLH